MNQAAKQIQKATPAKKVTLRVAISMITPGAVILSALAPAVFGLLLAILHQGSVSVSLSILLMLIPSLMNAAGNVLNDYYDYVQGNDTKDNIVSEDDGPLAYHQVEQPKTAFWFGMVLLVIAGGLGIYVILQTGILPAIIGIIGGVVLLTYSGGFLPTSYMPIGEVLSGFTMGGLIPLGVYTALTGSLDLIVLLQAMPMMLIITQFMLCNNTCDIQRDKVAGRKTLPILIGGVSAKRLANRLNAFWMISLCLLIAFFFPKGWMSLLLIIPLCGKGIIDTYHIERTRENKTPAVAATALTALGVAIGYPLAVFLHLCFA